MSLDAAGRANNHTFAISVSLSLKKERRFALSNCLYVQYSLRLANQSIAFWADVPVKLANNGAEWSDISSSESESLLTITILLAGAAAGCIGN